MRGWTGRILTLGLVVLLAAGGWWTTVTAQTATTNMLRIVGAATGSNPKLEAYGGDTNIGIALTTKGSGAITGLSHIELSSPTQSTATTTSYQTLAGDFNVSGAWGSSTAGSPTYGAGVMGNIIGASALTATKNILAGVVAKWDVPYAISTTYPAAALIAEIGDSTTSAYAAVLATVGGDTGTVTAKAAFAVDWQNSTKDSALDWFIDSQGGGTHDSYKAPRYAKGDIRLGGRRSDSDTSAGEDICLNRNAGTPTNGASGTFAGDCALSSLVVDTTNGSVFLNTGTKASPVWLGLGGASGSLTGATTTSFQMAHGDFNIGATWGSSTSGSPAYGAGGMFNLIGTGGNSATQNILAGAVVKFDLQGTVSSTYPAAALIAEIGDLTTGAYAAVLASLGGDSGLTTATALYGVDWQNSLAASLVDFGVDLQGKGTHDSYKAPRYNIADLRLGGRGLGDTAQGDDVCVFRFAAALVNGVSGTNAGNCGPGSLAIRTDTVGLYINTGTKASPTWTAL